jgi:hypothetical protein
LARFLSSPAAWTGALCAALWTSSVHAEEAAAGVNPLPATRGWELGARLGMAHPGGPVGAGAYATTPNVSDVAQTWVPLGIEGGYRFSPVVYAGATLAWGPLVGNQSGLCSACNFRYDLQVRPEVRLYLNPRGTVDPWFSVGPGWEVLHVSIGDSPSGDATYEGPFGEAEFGVDVRLHALAIGPYLGAAVGGFVTRSLDPEPAHESSSFGMAPHEWFTLGVRGSYGPW